MIKFVFQNIKAFYMGIKTIEKIVESNKNKGGWLYPFRYIRFVFCFFAFQNLIFRSLLLFTETESCFKGAYSILSVFTGYNAPVVASFGLFLILDFVDNLRVLQELIQKNDAVLAPFSGSALIAVKGKFLFKAATGGVLAASGTFFAADNAIMSATAIPDSKGTLHGGGPLRALLDYKHEAITKEALFKELQDPSITAERRVALAEKHYSLHAGKKESA
jgi:hypothetical protein